MKIYYRHAAESATEPQNIEWSNIGKVSNWGEDLAPVERVSVDFVGELQPVLLVEVRCQGLETAIKQDKSHPKSSSKQRTSNSDFRFAVWAFF